jgi:hypothetical protein
MRKEGALDYVVARGDRNRNRTIIKMILLFDVFICFLFVVFFFFF